ncbi:MAG: class I SAM-dependent methyltransferase [Acidimicrobiales bacterium]|nr:class I SAM-dependent methyltransferase [Acidimicrobiales bacterium]
MDQLPPNHHGDNNAKFGGPIGYLCALTMTIGRRGDGKLVTKLANVTANDHVLDIGCGPGTAVRIAASTGATVTGVDPAQPMLQMARLLTKIRPPTGTTEWIHAGCEDIPAPDDTYSVCWSLASVHHWPNLDAGLTEVRRVLRPGGRFIALEKQSPPGADGLASHGWAPDQADRFAAILHDFGFELGQVENHHHGRRKVVTVSSVLT